MRQVLSSSSRLRPGTGVFHSLQPHPWNSSMSMSITGELVKNRFPGPTPELPNINLYFNKFPQRHIKVQ